MLAYLCLIFLCLPMYCSAVPVSNGKIHTIALKSYRTSTYSDIQAGGVSKLISNGVKLTNEGELDLPATTYGPGNTKLLSDKDILWYAEIKIGTGEAEEVFLVDVDTGSSDLFIPGSMCQDNCQGHTKYDPSKSPTSKKTGKRFNLDFADKSSVRGAIYTDTVTVGTLVAEGQAIGVGEVYSKGLAKNIFSPDGLLGLGFAALSHMGTPPLMETLTRTKKIDHPMFGVRLDLARLNGDKGELTLGGYNEEHIAGPITYADVNDAKYWQVQLDHASVDNTVLATKQNLIIDTGSTLINANADFVNKLYKDIEGASRVPNSLRWTLPCDKIPTLVLTIAGRPFSIPPENFTPGRVEEGSPMCFGGIVANVEANEPWIVGGVFLSTVYTVFDAEKPRIGFGALKDDYDAQA